MSYEYELFDAVLDGDINEIKMLVDKGADIHEVTESERWTYLHHIFMSLNEQGPPESVQYLIDQGLDVNAIDCYGNTPLIYAVRQKNVVGMRLLLANGGDRMIEQRNIEGVDALKMSLKGKPYLYDMVKLLLDFGADPDAKREGGRSVREGVSIIAGVDPKIKELIEQYPSGD